MSKEELAKSVSHLDRKDHEGDPEKVARDNKTEVQQQWRHQVGGRLVPPGSAHGEGERSGPHGAGQSHVS